MGIPCTFHNLGSYRALSVASKNIHLKDLDENWPICKLLKTSKITKKLCEIAFLTAFGERTLLFGEAHAIDNLGPNSPFPVVSKSVGNYFMR